MEDEAPAAPLEPNDESDSETSLGRAASGPLPAEAGKRREVTLAELQDRFAVLEHDFAIFREGMTRPPTRAHDDEPAAPVAGRRLRTPSGRPGTGGKADGGAGSGAAAARPADGPRSQSVPPGARMLRNPSPADGRTPASAADDQIRPRQPPPVSRPPASAAAGAAQHPRPGAAAPERRLPSPLPPQKPRSAGPRTPEAAPAAARAAPAGGNGKPPSVEKKKKKVERPAWRDDFVVQEPWSRELAQEAASGDRGAPGEAEAAPRSRAPSAGLGGKGSAEGRERRWRTGASSDGGGGGAFGGDGRSGPRDAPASPGPARGPEPAEGAARGIPAAPGVARRKPQPATAASVRAAAVAAVMEAGRQQQLQAQQQVSKGGMMLVIPTGPTAPPGVTASQQQHLQAGPDAPRVSPSRISHIPASPPSGEGRRSESRPRTPQSRIPTFGIQQIQQQQQHDEWPPGDRGRRQSAPAVGAAAAGGAGPPGLGGGAGAAADGGANRPLAGGGISAAYEQEGPSLTRSAEAEETPPSSTSSNPQQRRRRQWEVPGATAAAGGALAPAEPVDTRAPAGAPRRVSASDGLEEGAALRGPARPSAAAPSGRVFNPTPPPSLPPSRPGSRPGSRPTSTTGEALTSAHSHHHPGSPLAFTAEDARMHISPSRPRAGERRSSGGDGGGGEQAAAGSGASGGPLARQPSMLPDVTFSAGLPPGLGLGPDEHSGPQGRRGSSPHEQRPAGNGDATASFHMGAAALAAPEATAELFFPPASNGWEAAAVAAPATAVASIPGGGGEQNSVSGQGPGGPGQGPHPGPAGPRDKEEYRRKLSALKRSVPHDPRRVTDEGGAAGGAAAAGVGGAGAGAGGNGQSRKWMQPGAGDVPLSAAPVEAVGSAPAAVRAARSRNFSAEVTGSRASVGGIVAEAPGVAVGVGGDAVEGAEDGADAAGSAAAAAAAGGRVPRPGKGRSQTQLKHRRSGSIGDLGGAPSYGGAGPAEDGQRPSEGGRVIPGMALQPDRPNDNSPSGPPSPVREAGAARGPGTRPPPPPPLQPPLPPFGSGSAEGPALGAPSAGSGSGALPGAISAEQYMAFAVQNPEVALAAAQVAVNANGGRARARWNVPPPPLMDPAPPGGAAMPPWAQPPPAQPPPPSGAAPPQQHLAAAMVSANSHGIPAVPLVCSPGQSQKPNLAAQGQMPLPGLAESHDLRRANSEGPRMGPGRLPGPDMQQQGGPPSSAPSGAGLGDLGPAPLGPPQYGGGHVPPPPMVQGLFPGGGGGPQGWPGPGPGDGLQDGSGRLLGYGAGAPYPSALQLVRPAVTAPGEMWSGGPGAGPGPPPLMHPGGLPPPAQPPPPVWNGYGYGAGGRPSGYMAAGGPGMPGPGPGPGLGEPHGHMGHTGPMGGGDPYKPLFKRNSNGHYDGFGGAGPGYASAPAGAVAGASGYGPGPGPGPGGGGSSDLPDYLRVSMSRMVAGWSAPNAKHGALSGFNDVWQHRNSNRPPPGMPGMPGYGSAGGAGAPGGPGFPGGPAGEMPPQQPVRVASAGGAGGAAGGGVGGGGGGGGRGMGFEGLSLEQVLASKPKKEAPNFKKKT